jgi:hypothetical protein
MRQKLKEKPKVVAYKYSSVERGFLRMCPICEYLGDDNTLFDPAMLYRHLKGPAHTREVIADALQNIALETYDELTSEKIRMLAQ